MKIYAIIVTYNAMRRGWIDRCLLSLRASTIPVTAIVIDNLSTDGTREHVPAHYPDAVWLPQEKNLGFGQANNIGLKYALDNNADYAMLLNQDASIAPGTLAHLVSACDGESLYSPLQLNGQGTDFDKMFGNYTMRKLDNGLLSDLLVVKQLKPAYPSGEFAAACWFMPANLIRKIGGFNPLFFQYGEDRNYYQRMAFHNVKSYVVPEATMFHDRELHGNIKVFNKNLLYNNVLLTVSNVNLNCLSRVKMLIAILVNCYVHELPRRQYRVGAFATVLFRIASCMGSIRKSIKQEKSVGLNWLAK